jgi:hypothetical protein
MQEEGEMKKIAAFVLMMLGSLTFLSAGRFEVGLSGGFFSSKSNSGAVLGISPGFRISRVVSLETGFFYYPSATDYSHMFEGGLYVLVGLIPYKENQMVVPYLTFGPAYFLWDDGSIEDIKMAVGGGLKKPMSKRVSLRIDFRYFFPLIPGNEYPAFENLWRGTVGVSFRL